MKILIIALLGTICMQKAAAEENTLQLLDELRPKATEAIISPGGLQPFFWVKFMPKFTGAVKGIHLKLEGKRELVSQIVVSNRFDETVGSIVPKRGDKGEILPLQFVPITDEVFVEANDSGLEILGLMSKDASKYPNSTVSISLENLDFDREVKLQGNFPKVTTYKTSDNMPSAGGYRIVSMESPEGLLPVSKPNSLGKFWIQPENHNLVVNHLVFVATSNKYDLKRAGIAVLITPQGEVLKGVVNMIRLGRYNMIFDTAFITIPKEGAAVEILVSIPGKLKGHSIALSVVPKLSIGYNTDNQVRLMATEIGSIVGSKLRIEGPMRESTLYYDDFGGEDEWGFGGYD